MDYDKLTKIADSGFFNPIGAKFRIKADAPEWVRTRLKGRGGMCAIRAWKCKDLFTRDGELYLTFENCYGHNESLPAKYFDTFEY